MTNSLARITAWLVVVALVTSSWPFSGSLGGSSAFAQTGADGGYDDWISRSTAQDRSPNASPYNSGEFGTPGSNQPPPSDRPFVPVEQFGPEVVRSPPLGATAPPVQSMTPYGMPGEAVSERNKEEENGFDIEDLSPTNTWKNTKQLFTGGPNRSVAHAAYSEGLRLFDRKQYEAAGNQFSAAAERWPDSTLEEDAMFMLAESLFADNRYPKARTQYEVLFEKYPYTRHLDTGVHRLFAIGRYWEQLAAARPNPVLGYNMTDKTRPWIDTKGHALKCYDAVRMYDPIGRLADHAVMATATAYYDMGRYEEAAYNYGVLRKEYPKSGHQVNAHLRELDSLLKMYQGPNYDGMPLEEATKVADQLLTQYGPELADRRQVVLDVKKRLAVQKAQRDWMIAQYYDKRGYYGAAGLYYQGMIQDYPETPLAESSRRRLTEIAAYPAKPPDRFGWLEEILSQDK